MLTGIIKATRAHYAALQHKPAPDRVAIDYYEVTGVDNSDTRIAGTVWVKVDVYSQRHPYASNLAKATEGRRQGELTRLTNRLFAMYPEVRSINWLPTKEPRYVDRGNIPANLVVRVSAPMVDQVGPKAWKNTSTVHTDKAPKGAHVCPAPKQDGACGKCRACWTATVRVVSSTLGNTHMAIYTLQAGRSILKDGAPFVHLSKSNNPDISPCDADKFARDIVASREAIAQIWELAQDVCEMSGDAARDTLIRIQEIAGSVLP